MTTPLRLKEWRTRRRLSLRALADTSGLWYSTVADIERGVISPTVVTLEALARALGITVRDLFPVSARPSTTRKKKETRRTKTTTRRPRPKT
jgi:transcriptional regulator with XRE-family HTH domain